MNKAELISAVSYKTGSTKIETKKTVEAVIEAISEELAGGGKVSLVGFGTFSVTQKNERVGINPKTKEKLVIPAKKAVRFKPGLDLAESVK